MHLRAWPHIGLFPKYAFSVSQVFLVLGWSAAELRSSALAAL